MANESPEVLGGLFRALSDPTRRAVVDRLLEGEASVTALAEPFPIALPTFLRHLGTLEGCGLVTSRKIGRVRLCALRPERLRTAERWLRGRRADWERRLAGLDDHLAEEGPDDP